MDIEIKKGSLDHVLVGDRSSKLYYRHSTASIHLIIHPSPPTSNAQLRSYCHPECFES